MFFLKKIKKTPSGVILQMAGAAGVEPTIMVLETMVIPFNYAPIPK